MGKSLSRGSLRKRIESLEKNLSRPEVDWGDIYDITMEMERTMGNMENENFENEYIKRYETRENFIKIRKETYKNLYGRR